MDLKSMLNLYEEQKIEVNDLDSWKFELNKRYKRNVKYTENWYDETIQANHKRGGYEIGFFDKKDNEGWYIK